jgi:hypothetical protein
MASKTILALDPGTAETAYLILDRGVPVEHEKLPNLAILGVIDCFCEQQTAPVHIVAEDFQSYGLPVGREVYRTVVWLGRYIQRAYEQKVDITLVYRSQIKKHHCPGKKANDAIIRAAMIKRFGEPGKKSAPGPTFGVTADEWSALAIAAWYEDTH